MLNLKMIIGSTRPGRAAGKVIPWITAVAARRDGALPPAVMRQLAGQGARR